MKFFLAALLIASVVLIQCLVGGTRLVFSLPSYGLLALAALATLIPTKRAASKPSNLCVGVTLAFFAYILARAALSPVDYLWWMDFFMVIACLIAYLLTTLYICDSRVRLLVLLALLALAVAEVLIGLRQFAQGDNWMPFGFLRAANGRRASGTLISPIHLSGYLEAVGIMAASLAFWCPWKLSSRLLVGYLAVMCYAGVAITGSRGGYLSSAFSLVVFAVISLAVIRKAVPHRYAGTLIAAVIGIVLVITSSVFLMSRSTMLQGRLSTIPDQFDTKKLDIRVYNWQAALDQFRVSPVLGTGAGTHIYYGRLFRRPQLQWDPIHAHCDYLELIAEYGIVAAVGMAAFLFVHVRNGFRSLGWLIRQHLLTEGIYHPIRGETLALQIGALSAIGAYLAHSAVDFNLHIPGNALLFAFLFGMLSNPALTHVESSDNRWLGVLRVSLPAMGAFMVAFGLTKWPGEYWCEKLRFALRIKDFTTANEFAQKALSYERRNPDTYYHLAAALAGLGGKSRDLQKRRAYNTSAVDAAQMSLDRFPYNEHAWVRKGRLLDRLGRFREAGEAFTNALSLDPQLGALHREYATHLLLVGRPDDARIALARAASLNAPKLGELAQELAEPSAIP